MIEMNMPQAEDSSPQFAPPSNHAVGDSQTQFRPELLSELSEDLCEKMSAALKRFSEINMQTQILSINAAIEASRAGDAGRSFAVVANQMKDLSQGTAQVADALGNEVQNAIERIDDFSRILGTQVRGMRLVDLALTNIDLIDRNLYERSCDVRWWATDSSVCDACEDPSPERVNFASKRLGVILDAYTVYFDLVLCDLEGEVIANGRPRAFHSQGMNCANEKWFKEAKASHSGDEFGFQAVHASPLVRNQRILAYSCGVRRGGEARGQLVGVLGILFNWDALAGTIVKQTPIAAAEWPRTRVCIVDRSGQVLADSAPDAPTGPLQVNRFHDLVQKEKGFEMQELQGRPTIVAHAPAPGYETYTTGWHSFILQALR